MSRPRKRDIANARSASAPPLFPQIDNPTGSGSNKRTSESRSSSRATERQTPCADGVVVEGQEVDSPRPPAAQSPPTGQSAPSRSATAHLLLGISCTEPHPCDDRLPSEEDFVEGGEEIEPISEDVEELSSTPRATRPLPLNLEDRQLEEFWPRDGGQRALFLDYDGTLREFESKPELATVTDELHELLQAFNDREDLFPHIISGRDAKFLEAQFGKYSNFTLIAEHGFQIWRSNEKGWNLCDHPDGLDPDHDDWKEIVRKEMTRSVSLVPCSFIEEKASCLVWHYRLAEDQDNAESLALDVKDRLEILREQENLVKCRVSHGHKVVEVSYRKVRKGPVMRRICEEKLLFGNPFVSVLVAGDDVSDESMFSAAPDDFLSIKVGDGATLAKFRTDSPASLRKFLWQIACPPFASLTAAAKAAPGSKITASAPTEEKASTSPVGSPSNTASAGRPSATSRSVVTRKHPPGGSPGSGGGRRAERLASTGYS